VLLPFFVSWRLAAAGLQPHAWRTVFAGPRVKTLAAICTALTLVLTAASLSAQTSRLTPYADARETLAALAEILPPELRGDRSSRESAWPAWIAAHDKEIRNRIARGDADTLVNWLLFGRSFTRHKRVFLDGGLDLGRPAGAGPSTAELQEAASLIAGRIHDFIEALATPGTDERRRFARQELERLGFRVDSAPERARLADHLRREVSRVLGEQQAHAREIQQARSLTDSSADFAARSRVYRERGLSLDTLIQPSFALERALGRMSGEKLIAPGSLRRVAVIGPGLDFSDKTTGYDFYPLQTLQPFALLDSLIRLGLADPKGVQLTAFDLNPRVIQHLTSARTRAKAGTSYTVRIPLDLAMPWNPDLIAYWKQAGDRVGSVVAGSKPDGARKQPEIRTISITPNTMLQVTPSDLNIVTSQPTSADFDLIVATNVFVYYDTLDQALALANVERMLRPDGFLLSNNALLELPTSKMRSVGYLSVPYSDRPDDGDHVVWYRRDR